MEYVTDGVCCHDCLFYLAYAEMPPDWSEEQANAWLAEIQRRCEGYHVVLGKPTELHDCRTRTGYAGWWWWWRSRAYVDADASDARIEFTSDIPLLGNWILRNDRAYDLVQRFIRARSHTSDRAEECDCEEEHFSHSACDVCGSNLAGSRYAVSWFAD